MADPIHIKPSHKGRFARAVGKKPGTPISSADIAKGKASSSAKVRKEAVFAQNARKWNHGSGPKRKSDRSRRMYGKE
jgi:hypothetical protein